MKALWRVFWGTAGAVNIRIKIMGVVAASIAISASTMLFYEQRDDLAALRGQLQERGIALGTGLAAQSRDLVLTDNQLTLYGLIEDIRKADPELLYVYILDAKGDVLVHTFNDGFPTDLLGKNELLPGQPYQIRQLQSQQERIQDIAVPILGGRAGVIHLGLTEVAIRATVARHVRNISLWMGLVLVMGLCVAYVLASILTKPLSRLAEATSAIERGDFKWQSPVWAKDEIGALGGAFNSMSQELRRKEEMRLQLLAKVISAQEEERKRIARELHDETSQSITSLTVDLRLVENSSKEPLVIDKVAELRVQAARILDQVRHLATELRPALLDDLGLVAAIQQYTREYSSKFGLDVDFQIIGMESHRLPGPIEIALYRIVQEALTNVAKHAGAKKVSILMEARHSSILTIIEDDGKGFDVQKLLALTGTEGRLGIYGMQERASLIGGTFTIESAPKGGTTIFVEVPFQERVAT